MNPKPILYSKIIRSSEAPKMVRLLIKNKIVRTEIQAIYFLMLIVVISSILAIYFFLSLSVGLTKADSFIEMDAMSQTQ